MDIKRLQELSGILTEGDVVNFPGNAEREQKTMADHEEKISKDGVERAEKQRVGSGEKAPKEVLRLVSAPLIDRYALHMREYLENHFDKHPNLSPAAKGHIAETAIEHLTSHIREEFDPQ